MEDESTGPSAKQKNSGENEKEKRDMMKMMMILIQLLQQWKQKLNQKF